MRETDRRKKGKKHVDEDDTDSVGVRGGGGATKGETSQTRPPLSKLVLKQGVDLLQQG